MRRAEGGKRCGGSLAADCITTLQKDGGFYYGGAGHKCVYSEHVSRCHPRLGKGGMVGFCPAAPAGEPPVPIGRNRLAPRYLQSLLALVCAGPDGGADRARGSLAAAGARAGVCVTRVDEVSHGGARGGDAGLPAFRVSRLARPTRERAVQSSVQPTAGGGAGGFGGAVGAGGGQGGRALAGGAWVGAGFSPRGDGGVSGQPVGG